MDPLAPRGDPDRARASRRPATPVSVDLAMEAAATDREARFHLRREEMMRQRAHAHRRRAATGRAAWGCVAAGAIAIGAAANGIRGALAGLVAVAIAAAAAAVAGRVAARRGASAWDWQAQRYRLYGRPADRVQALDRPDGPRERF